jgi:membrane-associated phospholipid phosphatase
MKIPNEISPRHDRREFLRALAYALALSVYFFLVYATCNTITAHRSDVGHAGFLWEARLIPFVPAMIVPYMSIDLFFFTAPFLCTIRRERRNHARRVVLAVAIAGACFLLFPLTTSFPRPNVTGIFAPVFNFLYGFDRPYNLVPSLHIALRSLLWIIYIPHTRGLTRIAVKVWFILIGLSTLLTHQHHLIDVATGQLLGLFCLHLFPDRIGAETNPSPARNVPVAGWYALGAVAMIVTAYALRPWGLLLVWPATALTVMAAAYLGVGAAVFRKRDGRLPPSTYVVLGPYLLGARLWFRLRTRRDEPFAAIAPNLLIGRRVGRPEAQRLIDRGVRTVLDLSPEFSETRAFRRLAYLNIPVLDLTTPSPDQLCTAVAFVRRHASNGTVYIHCAWGYSRSACVAAAYLLATGRAATASEAVEITRASRTQLVIRPAAEAALRAFADLSRAGDSFSATAPVSPSPLAAMLVPGR